jgi:lycopene beta-cyclase
MSKHYNYIIIGGGLSGLLMAYRMANDAFFDDSEILIIEKNTSKKDDRTWCFWEKSDGEWDDIIYKSWPKIFVANKNYEILGNCDPFLYKMIRSDDFYTKIHQKIKQKNNISYVFDCVISLEKKINNYELKCEKETYFGTIILNSLWSPEKVASQKKYPYLKQHFVGWFIKTNIPCFDPSTATFMDFNIPQQGNTRFMYVLPISTQEALFEYTLFSEDLLPFKAYEQAIKDYLASKEITAYEIIKKEYGNIPMTCYRFDKHNTASLIHIGTAGGWTKASTGFTFYNSLQKSAELTTFLKTKKDLTKFSKRTRYWWYDLILLEVLHQNNTLGAEIFGTLFKKFSVERLFVFLNEKGSFMSDLKIMHSLHKGTFIKGFFKAFLKLIKK